MDKEKLEEIKEDYVIGTHSIFGDLRVSVPKANFEYLISTVEEQQKEIECWKELHGSLSKRTTYLNKENARLREAVNEIHFQASIVETPDNVYAAITQGLKE